MMAKGQVLLRFLVLNISGFALLFAAWLQGWISQLISGDGTRISAGIAVVFLGGLGLTALRALRIDRAVSAGSAAPLGYGLTSIEAVRIRLGEELGTVRNIANALVFLGLIGTVVGIVIALSAVDPDAVADPAKVAPMVAELVDGMGVRAHDDAGRCGSASLAFHELSPDRRRGDCVFGDTHRRQAA